MRGSHKIARIAGIDVKVHWTFLILLGWFFFSYYREMSEYQSVFYGLGLAFAVFVCILAHELGHALMARRVGVRTRETTLLPIGGLAVLDREPLKASEEISIALAGPAVNFAIAIVLYAYMAVTDQLVNLVNYSETISSLVPVYFAENIFAVNLVLVLFNLIPAFPMDGGRVLRAVLATRWERAKATRFASGIGRALAIGFVFMGFFGNFWLVFIGLVIYLGALAESRQVLTKSVLEGYKVGDVLKTNVTRLYQHDPLQSAVDLLLEGTEKDFLVFDTEEFVVGVLKREGMITALASGRPNLRIADAPLATPLELHKQLPLQEAFELMMGEHACISPVYDGQKLAGVLKQENVQEFLLLRGKDARDDAEDIYDGSEELEPAEDSWATR